MSDLDARKQKLFTIMDGYAGFLERRKDEKREMELLSQRKNAERTRYHIAIIGSGNRGKSTLLNALLGNREQPEISPMNVESATAAIVYYNDSKLYPRNEGKVGAIVHFRDGSDEEHIGISDIRRYVDQSIPGFDKGQAERVRYIHVYIPFPWIEKRGVFVDTPGRGALYNQNKLAESVLDEVDVIICPFMSTNYLDKNEDEFLRKLPDTEKKKLMYVLTAIEKPNTPKDLANAVKAVTEKARDVSGGDQPIYRVDAKKVWKANLEGKSETEIEQIKQDWGMRELETALDEKLREGTNADKRIREVCTELEKMLREDIKGLGKEIEDFDSKRVEEDLRKKEAEVARQRERDAFDKSIKDLKRKWDEEVRQAIAKIDGKGAELEDLDPDHVKVGSAYRNGKRALKNIKQGTEHELAELKRKLESAVKTCAQECDLDVDEDIAIGRFHSGRNRDDSGFWKGIVVAVGSGIAGISLVVWAIGRISPKHAQYQAARLAAQIIEIDRDRSKGDRPTGGEVIDATTDVATASHEFWGAVGQNVPFILLGIGVIWGAIYFGLRFYKKGVVKNVSRTGEIQLEKTVDSIKDESGGMFEYIKGRLTGKLEEKLWAM